MIQFNVRNRILITCILYGVIDDLYQKSARFSKLKLFFSIRSIRLSTVATTRSVKLGSYLHVWECTSPFLAITHI